MAQTLLVPSITHTAPGQRGALAALARWCYDHRRRVVLLWLAALIGFSFLGRAEGSRFDNNFGSGSAAFNRIVDSAFPSERGSQNQVVIVTSGSVTAASVQARTAELVAALTPLAHVSGVISPFSPTGGGQISRDGHVAYLRLSFDEQTGSLPASAVQRVIDTARSFQAPGYRIALGGPAIELVAGGHPGSSEGAGILAAIIIMLLAFGSVVAMGLPLLTALFGLGIAVAVLDLTSHLVTTPSFAPEMMAMIGLGVGIDYALFVVTRYRQELAAGRTPREATELSLATSGRSVVFAGTTVILSLLGLFILRLPFIEGQAVGAIAAVVLVMLSAVTMLPALLGFAGPSIDRLRVRGLLRVSAEPGGHRNVWYRWSRTVQRHPVTSAAAALVCLLLLAIPFFSLRLAFTDAGNDPAASTTRQAFVALAKGFGPGFNGPLLVAATVPAGQAGTIEALQHRIAATPGVAYAAPPLFGLTHELATDAVLVVYPTTSPQSTATQDLVLRLRDSTIPSVTRGTGVAAFVGGETAGSIDSTNYLSSHLLWVIGSVLLLALLLLMAVFRSVVIAITAVLMNVLSVGAAYGVIVAVFQWGWLGSLFRIGATSPIDPWIPLMMFTILFGLSMDYQVFLLSRIREEWRRSGDTSASIADGLAKTARVITAAAAIMICVFGSFVINDPLHVLKVFGLGLASAILIDATLVRMVLVPSVMELLGERNWWMPRWLNRVLPALGTEVDVAVSPAMQDA